MLETKYYNALHEFYTKSQENNPQNNKPEKQN